MSNIKLSIVTVCYNCEKEIEMTIDSILEQLDNINPKEIEYIIVDGNSKDKTVQIATKRVEEFKKFGVKTKLISENDNGIYDAMNKGINLANGKYINMLNAGDFYCDSNVLYKVIEKINTTNADCLYGNTYRVSDYLTEEWKPGNIEDIKKHMIFCHQSLFIKKDLNEHYYNTSYRYCADYDLVLRLFLNNKKFDYIDTFITNYSLDGVTANKSMIKAYKEIFKIRKENSLIKSKLEFLKYYLGLFKRKCIMILPNSLRWKISKFLNKFRKKRFY